MNSPPYGDLSVGDRFQKHNYPFGVLVNARGERFLDEGLDFHSYTYAKYGHEVMKQPGLFAWQIFDQKIVHLLREEYRIARITKEQGEHARGTGTEVDRRGYRGSAGDAARLNAAPRPDVAFNPNIHDGLRTFGLAVDKTNWAQTLDTPPYHAYGVTAGVTFTFGGLKTTTSAEVEDISGVPIRWTVRRGRDPWWTVFPQLRQRNRTGCRRGVRAHRRAARGRLRRRRNIGKAAPCRSYWAPTCGWIDRPISIPPHACSGSSAPARAAASGPIG